MYLIDIAFPNSSDAGRQISANIEDGNEAGSIALGAAPSKEQLALAKRQGNPTKRCGKNPIGFPCYLRRFTYPEDPCYQ